MYSKLVRRIESNILSLATVKQHLVVDHDDDDAIITLYRDAAIEHIENVTRRTLLLSEYRMTLDKFDYEMSLRCPPIRAISEINYKNSDNVEVTLSEDDYVVNTDYEWALIKISGELPVGSDIVLKVVAGYGTMPSYEGFPYTFPLVLSPAGEYLQPPKPIDLAVLMLTAHWYEHREEVSMASMNKVPAGVDSLLFKYRNYKS